MTFTNHFLFLPPWTELCLISPKERDQEDRVLTDERDQYGQSSHPPEQGGSGQSDAQQEEAGRVMHNREVVPREAIQQE